MLITLKSNRSERAVLKIRRCIGAAIQKVRGKPWRQLVVCGFPRSGTSLIYNMLATTLPGFRFEEFENYFMYRMHRFGDIASKAPMDVLHLGRLDKLNILRKETIVLIMTRDIRSVLVSKHPMLPDRYFIGWDHSWWPQDRQFSKWNYDAPGVVEIFKAIIDAEARGDVVIVKYEDLVRNPDSIQDLLRHKFGFDFSRNFSNYQEHPELHPYRYEGRHAAKGAVMTMESSAVSPTRIEGWKGMAQRQRILDQFRACDDLFRIIEYFGYEHSRDWFRELELAEEADNA